MTKPSTTQTQAALNTFVKETGGWVAGQLEACTRCGMCAEACHFYQATRKPRICPGLENGTLAQGLRAAVHGFRPAQIGPGPGEGRDRRGPRPLERSGL